jgi:hypothetical protein
MLRCAVGKTTGNRELDGPQRLSLPWVQQGLDSTGLGHLRFLQSSFQRAMIPDSRPFPDVTEWCGRMLIVPFEPRVAGGLFERGFVTI